MAPRALPFFVAALVWTAGSALLDARKGRISNRWTLAPLVAAPLAWAFAARGAPTVLGLPGFVAFAALSLLGALLCGAVPLLLFRLSMIGGADVKVLAGVGALLLPRWGLLVELSAFCSASLLLPAWFAYRGQLFSTLLGGLGTLANPLRAPSLRGSLPPSLRHRVHFAPFIFAGLSFAMLVWLVG